MISLSLKETEKSSECSIDAVLAAVCPSIIKDFLMKMAPEQRNQVQELRLRQDRPLSILLDQRECFLTVKGEPTFDPLAGYYITKTDIDRVFQSITRNSVYALEEELRNGYVTIAGGHRIGFTGEAVVVGGKVKT